MATTSAASTVSPKHLFPAIRPDWRKRAFTHLTNVLGEHDMAGYLRLEGLWRILPCFNHHTLYTWMLIRESLPLAQRAADRFDPAVRNLVGMEILEELHPWLVKEYEDMARLIQRTEKGDLLVGHTVAPEQLLWEWIRERTFAGFERLEREVDAPTQEDMDILHAFAASCKERR